MKMKRTNEKKSGFEKLAEEMLSENYDKKWKPFLPMYSRLGHSVLKHLKQILQPIAQLFKRLLTRHNDDDIAIDARELYDALGIKQNFLHWVKKMIKQCKLVEDKDFLIFVEKRKSSERGRPIYVFPLRSARLICAAENSKISLLKPEGRNYSRYLCIESIND